MLVWWCVAALAKKPTGTVAADDGEAGAWYRDFRARVSAVQAPVREAVRSLVIAPDPATAEPRRVAVVTEAEAARAVLAEVPPFAGDPTLPAAADAWFVTVIDVAGDLPTLWATWTAPPVGDEDLRLAGRLYPELVGRLDAADAAWEEAQLAFASRHAVRLAGREVFRPPPRFEAPDGVVPPGSDLPAELVVRIAAGYRDQLAARAEQALAAWRAWRDAPSAEGLADGLATARRAITEARELGGWQGDAALRDATIALGTAVLVALSGAPRDEAARAEAEARVESALAAYQVADHEFDVRWAIGRYREWSSGADAGGRSGRR